MIMTDYLIRMRNENMILNIVCVLILFQDTEVRNYWWGATLYDLTQDVFSDLDLNVRFVGDMINLFNISCQHVESTNHLGEGFRP